MSALSYFLALSAALSSGPVAPLQSSAPTGTVAGPQSRPIAQAVRIAGTPPVIDGRLDDDAWALATVSSGFVQMRPTPGQAESERTEVRVLYDDGAIYVGMRLHDGEPEGIASQLARRDASGIHSDWAHVLIDSYYDRRTAFRFSVNPQGVQKDVLHFDDSSEDANWDAVWTAQATRDSLGWTAEFRIPLSQLRYSAEGAGVVWGVNFGREIARRGEWSWWSPVLPTVGGVVSQAGDLHGLEGIRSARRLEVLPYSVGSVTRAPGDLTNPLYARSDPGLAVGADLRYGITSNITLSATVNPDFGQVEADPSVVNLGSFETFFAEKRPFFIEGSNIFNFGIGTDDGSGEGLFYSRRIGRSPQRSLDAGDGWVSAPEATRILAAGKISGKTSSGWTIGLLNATTGRETAALADRRGVIAHQPVEPLANYSVGTLSRDFRGGQSAVGLMGTATHRQLGDEGVFDFLRRSAFSGGVNGRHRFAQGTWQANGYVGASHIRGSEDAITRVQRASGHYFQRPDAKHLELDPTRTSLTGAIANFGVWKIGGSSLRGGIGGHARTPGLEVNDLGFQNEADQLQLFGNISHQSFQPRGIFRRWNVGLNPFSAWTTGGERTITQLGHWANAEFTNFLEGGWWVGRRTSALSTVTLRGGPALHRPAGLNYSVWFNTDRRRRLTASWNIFGGFEDEGGRWNYGFGPGVTYRPSSQMTLTLRPQLNRNNDTWQYVAQPSVAGSTRYLVGHLDQTTLSLTSRLNYTVSRTLSLELYAQPFVSGGDYLAFREVADPRATSFDQRFRTLAPEALRYDEAAQRYHVDGDRDGDAEYSFRDPDFNVKQFRSNAVLRWEYRPGSTVFVVWSQGRSDRTIDGSFDASRDFGRLFGFSDEPGVAATNVLLVKLNYWLNF